LNNEHAGRYMIRMLIFVYRDQYLCATI
jgi:hypothetical protein